jgi:hypothetical protein
MGLFRRVRDIFDRHDDDKEKNEEQRQEGGGEQPASEAPATAEAAAAEAPVTPEPAGAEPSPTAPATEPVFTATEAAAAVETAEGTVSGAGLDRVYTTRAGDTLEVIAAYFYGTEIQRQRLLDDNPDLNLEQYGGSLPGGIRIRVSEDVSRGDTVGGSPSA